MPVPPLSAAPVVATAVTGPLTVWRLRPVVHASPVDRGLHVRGWTSSFTVDGGPGLWKLWRALDRTLAAGATGPELEALSAVPAVRAALQTLLGQLREHDMLVAVPADLGADPVTGLGTDDPVAGWLLSVAADPAHALRILRTATVEVHGAGPVADAARRALEAAGVSVGKGSVATRSRPVVPGTPAVLRCGAFGVAAHADDEVAFVTPVVSAGSAGAAAAALVGRLGLRPGAPAAVPAALVGAAAAHRLLCAVAGLPDPGVELSGDAAADGGAGLPAAGWPTVLVARLDPLRAGYHRWGATGPAGLPRSLELGAALAHADVLTDPELGVAPPVELAELPQVPAGLARTAPVAGARGWVGVGATPDVARLLATLGAAGTACGRAGAAGAGGSALGFGVRHATGTLLRDAARTLPATADVECPDWAHDAVVRRWLKAVTLRFGVEVGIDVHGLGPGIVRARVSGGAGADGWSETAVEATARDAVAFGLLAAVGRAQSAAAGGDVRDRVLAPSGATPAPPTADLGSAPWQSGAWAWPVPEPGHGSGEANDDEAALQERLRDLLGRPRIRVSAARDAAGLLLTGVVRACFTAAPATQVRS